MTKVKICVNCNKVNGDYNECDVCSICSGYVKKCDLSSTTIETYKRKHKKWLETHEIYQKNETLTDNAE